MQRFLRLSLSLSGVVAFALSNADLLPAAAEDSVNADDLGMLEINLKDAVQFNWGFQGALQGAGTPNQSGIGGFLPLSVGDNSVFFVDAAANVNFADRSNFSSIVDTTVAGTTISTSSRLGYRWLNSDRSWMYGINAGYDSRPMNSGYADSGISVEDGSAFYQQLALNLEVISNQWSLNAYGLMPVGDTNQELNWNYNGGALQSYGLDAGYMVMPNLQISIGSYYQKGDYNNCKGEDEVDNVGIRARISFEIATGLVAGINASYDDSYDSRFTADFKYRFGSNSYDSSIRKKDLRLPTVLDAISSTPSNRDVRVHDVRLPATVFRLGCTQEINVPNPKVFS